MTNRLHTTLCAGLLAVLISGCAGPSPGEPESPPEVPRPERPTAPASTDPAGGGVDIASAVAALPTSTFRVVYAVSGDPNFEHLEVSWKPPKTRLSGTYAGYSFDNYLDTSTGTWTLCITILGEYTCDADTVTELAALAPRIEAFAPTAAAETVLTLSRRPRATTEQSTTAGVPTACVHNAGRVLCIAASGALLYAAGIVTMSVNDGPTSHLTFEAIEYTTEVSEEDVTP